MERVNVWAEVLVNESSGATGLTVFEFKAASPKRGGLISDPVDIEVERVKRDVPVAEVTSEAAVVVAVDSPFEALLEVGTKDARGQWTPGLL